MKTILLLHDESGSPKPRLQNVADGKPTQRPSEGTPGCNCDRWGHPSPPPIERRTSNLVSSIPRNQRKTYSTSEILLGETRANAYEIRAA
jgi:hypothetical protein